MDRDDYEHLGVRSDDEDYGEGDRLPASRVWADDEPQGDEVDGTSATRVRNRDVDAAIRSHKRFGYVGRRLYLIGGHYATYGDDPGEVIIRDAVVIETLQ